jgi:hypothetical protein
LLAHRVATSLTAGAAMTLALVVVLIVRVRKSLKIVVGNAER